MFRYYFKDELAVEIIAGILSKTLVSFQWSSFAICPKKSLAISFVHIYEAVYK